jgi:hypothetical protein
MIELNFMAIGKIPGECIFVHKDDVSLLTNEENTRKVKCIAINFQSKRTSVSVTIYYMLSVCPYDPVISEDERNEINEMVIKVLSKKKVQILKKKFEKNKYSKRQTGKGTEYLSEEPPQTFGQ